MCDSFVRLYKYNDDEQTNSQLAKSMENKELELNEKELENVSGGNDEIKIITCPHCGSMNVVPFHSPSKGTAYLCCDCYRSFTYRSVNRKDL